MQHTVIRFVKKLRQSIGIKYSPVEKSGTDMVSLISSRPGTLRERLNFTKAYLAASSDVQAKVVEKSKKM